MTATLLLGGFMLAAAVAYVLTGGADYGGGVWDLFARGPRKRAQRELVEQAIAPIWETNHVWLIALVVLLFSGFPRAFAAVSTALHIPLTLLLIGIVARGAAFTFRAYDAREDRVQERWGRVFSISSAVTPVLLGVVVGSLSTGGIVLADGIVTSGFFAPWATSPFPWAVGVLTLALFAYLAAVYLTVEADDEALRGDFRFRALAAAIVAAIAAAATLVIASFSAPALFAALTGAPWAAVLFALTTASAVVAAIALVKRRYRLARIAAAAQIALVVLGWGAAQYPYLLAGELTLEAAAAPANVQVAILVIFTAGGIPLALALRYLFRVFKRA